MFSVPSGPVLPKVCKELEPEQPSARRHGFKGEFDVSWGLFVFIS